MTIEQIKKRIKIIDREIWILNGASLNDHGIRERVSKLREERDRLRKERDRLEKVEDK